MESTMKSIITRIENSSTLGTWTVDTWKRGRVDRNPREIIKNNNFGNGPGREGRLVMASGVTKDDN